MKVLGLDTSGYVNAVGVVENGRVLAEGRYPAKTDSLEQIVDNIDATLKEADLKIEDIEGFGVGAGPGSWRRPGSAIGKNSRRCWPILPIQSETRSLPPP